MLIAAPGLSRKRLTCMSGNRYFDVVYLLSNLVYYPRLVLVLVVTLLTVVLLFECIMERVGSLKRDKRTGETIDGDKSRKRTGSGSSHSSLVGFEARYPVSCTRKEGASMREE